MFRLAHLTDPHVGPLPRPQLRQLLSKRLTGWYNWHRSRQASHDMELLALLVADLLAQAPDHIACTGDVSNIGLPDEWPTARVFMDGLGRPADVSFVPGNHDAYVPGSLEGLLDEIAPFTAGDDGQEGCFPYLRRRGPVALIGLSSAIPTLPFVASGRIGGRQREEAEAMLAELGRDRDCFRVVMVIARAGAELILHGHNHVGSLTSLIGPRGPVPVVGAPSASARGGTLTHKAGYHLFTIDRDRTGFLLRAELRGLKPDGTVGGLGLLSLGRVAKAARPAS
jgi:hypothetical protein